MVVLQTIAANLGSMLTPIGNPQNLYLYGKAGLSLGAFVRLMLPYAAASLLLTVLLSLVQSRTCRAPIAVSCAEKADLSGRTGQLAAYLVLFALALLTVVLAQQTATSRRAHFSPRPLPAVCLLGSTSRCPGLHQSPNGFLGEWKTANC